MADRTYPLGLFSRVGIEIEYMIVDIATLEVLPIADRLMESVAGNPVSEIVHEEITWSNELALHVLELKTTDPVLHPGTVESAFQREIEIANKALASMGAKLMPTGMHPWMNPGTEMRIWPHEYSEIYYKYNEIFNCSGHGWANLQSTHINLPFANEEEFVRLHAAIRCLLPLLPALAASSPFVNGHARRKLDMRLQFYSQNSTRIPSVAGQIIPEKINSYQEYEKVILEPMYRDVCQYDPKGVLKHEWLNSRGAIARFDRGSIEIRVLDSQESVAADLAIVWLVFRSLQFLVDQRWSSLTEQQNIPQEVLVRLFNDSIIRAEKVTLLDEDYLELFELEPHEATSGKEFWSSLLKKLESGSEEDVFRTTLEEMLRAGTLASRIVQARKMYGDGELKKVYHKLCNCLSENRLFRI